jgi:hypothetical protein
MFFLVFRIRIGFNADSDPDPAFASMRIRIQGAQPIQIHAEPDPGQTLVICHKTEGTVTYAGTIVIWKGWKSDLFVSFGQFPCSGSAKDYR